MTALSFDDERPHYPRVEPRRRTTRFLLLMVAAAVAGAAFAAVSTNDFIRHLDRQVHSIHCSFIPGAGAAMGDSGCRTVMMSPYSSLFRDSLWGGIPISLWALAVFAYLAMHSARLTLAAAPANRHDSRYLIAAAALPLAMSGIYGFIAVHKIAAVCKLCVGIYTASVVLFVGALLTHANAVPTPRHMPAPIGRYLRWFGEGVAYVAVLTAAYVAFAPTSVKPLEGCGTLVKPADRTVLIPLRVAEHGTPALAVLDPLCPACKGFDERLHASDLYRRLRLDGVLFPLDSTCNWMVKESVHPGACAVSEVMLCDKAGAQRILAWAFQRQTELREVAATSDGDLRHRLEREFPSVRGCLGSARVKNQVNRSLRWAVANALPVLTPQLFIGEKRVCDEDTDLGLEYTVARLLGAAAAS